MKRWEAWSRAHSFAKLSAVPGVLTAAAHAQPADLGEQLLSAVKWHSTNLDTLSTACRKGVLKELCRPVEEGRAT